MGFEEEFIIARARSAIKKTRILPSEKVEIKKRKVPGLGNAYQLTKTGYREDLKLTLRSGWESNIARVMQAHSIPFKFEPELFPFPIKRGTRGYVPDFYLPETKEYIEVKGYMDKKSQLKIKRFKKYYPEQAANLFMIISKSSKIAVEFCEIQKIPVLFYEAFSTLYKRYLPNWEGK